MATPGSKLSVVLAVSDDTVAAMERIGSEPLRALLAESISTAIYKAEAAAVSAGAARVWKRAILSKADGAEEERYVLGIVMEPDSVDTQGDTQDAETIRKACFGFMEAYRSGGDAGHMGLMHKQIVDDKVAILECYIQKSEENFGAEVVKAGSWLMAIRVMDDELWAAVKAGDLTGFSIGGSAVREAVA